MAPQCLDCERKPTLEQLWQTALQLGFHIQLCDLTHEDKGFRTFASLPEARAFLQHKIRLGIERRSQQLVKPNDGVH